MELETMAGNALINASIIYPIFQTYYTTLVSRRHLVEYFVGDISLENWKFEESTGALDENRLASFYKTETIFFVSVFPSLSPILGRSRANHLILAL